MKVFLDTSSLIKLYHKENGTKELQSLFLESKIIQIFLSEITKVEFASTIWKKIRTKEVSLDNGILILNLFEEDLINYHFIMIDGLLIEQARKLMLSYGIEGLRTLDSIQLSTCVILKNEVDLFLTSDKLLNKLIEREGLNIAF